MNLAFALISLAGTTLIVVRGTVFGFLQKMWPALFQCAQCAGMWVGASFAAIGAVQVHPNVFINAFFVGSATSLTALLADALLVKLLGDPDQEEET